MELFDLDRLDTEHVHQLYELRLVLMRREND